MFVSCTRLQEKSEKVSSFIHHDNNTIIITRLLSLRYSYNGFLSHLIMSYFLQHRNDLYIDSSISLTFSSSSLNNESA